MVAPLGVRPGLLERIAAEAEHARACRQSWIRIKANSIVDEELIDAMYVASKAGVPIDLVVRGICALRPGVPGLSETIRVRSIVGRFLEHSRVLAFSGGGDPEYWLGSADLMHRNLDRRVETMVRVKDPGVQAQLAGMLDRSLADDVTRWELAADGSWSRRAGRDVQLELIARTRDRATS